MALPLTPRPFLPADDAPAAPEAAPHAPAVLFVCRHGSVKSPIARELLLCGARARGVALTAGSRGVTPEQRISPDLAAALGACGIEVSGESVLELTSNDIAEADLIVTFDWPPDRDPLGSARDWSDILSSGEDHDRCLGKLSCRIEALLDDVAGAGGTS